MANEPKHTTAIRYAICPHCRCEARHGVRTCPGCEAAVSYGMPLAFVIVAVAATGWMCFHAHRFFFDSWLVALLLAALAAGGVLVLLHETFDERVVFRKKRRPW